MIVYLEIKTWVGYSAGAVHYYGKLVDRYGDGNLIVEVSYNITQKEATELNNHDEYDSYKKGDESLRFDSEDLLIKRACKIWKKHFPKGVVLICGRTSIHEPQTIIAGPSRIKKKVNSLRDEAERIDFWEGEGGERMDEICAEWEEIFEKAGLL